MLFLEYLSILKFSPSIIYPLPSKRGPCLLLGHHVDLLSIFSIVFVVNFILLNDRRLTINCLENNVYDHTIHHHHNHEQNDDEETIMAKKYLNIRCDFEAIPARGCYLRESYCSLHVCICKPDYPINIADRLCLAKYKNIGDVCQFDQECQQGMLCTKVQNNNFDINNNSTIKQCQCKSGYVYSYVQKQCVRGLKGASCHRDKDCLPENMFCSLFTCECKYGYQWFPTGESCLKRSRYGEHCDQSINCKVYDEFSECDPLTKKCVCGEFLSRKYTLDEITQRCISCPMNRYNQSSNTCLPRKVTVEYGLLNESTSYSHRYSNLALNMAPFILFALIGFAYRMHTWGTIPDSFPECPQAFVLTRITTSENDGTCSMPTILDDTISPSSNTTANSHYCLPISAANIFDTSNDQNTMNDTSQTACLLRPTTMILPVPSHPHPEPPPSYDLASQDLPPSYDEAIADDNNHLINDNGAIDR